MALGTCHRFNALHENIKEHAWVRLGLENVQNLRPALHRSPVLLTWLEIFHRNVYSAGRAHESQGRAIGAAQEMPKIRDCIRDFSDRIVARAEAFLNGREVSEVGELVLTGGGNNIPAIQEALRQSLEKRGVKATHAPKLDKSTSVPGPYSELAQDLARGGSALGGASVLFDLEDY